LANKTAGKADLVIGKDSWVRAESAAKKVALAPVAMLSGLDGSTTQKGVVVVAGIDPALTVNDLKGYKVLFGPAEALERHAAAFALVEDLGMETPAKPDIAAEGSAAAG